MEAGILHEMNTTFVVTVAATPTRLRVVPVVYVAWCICCASPLFLRGSTPVVMLGNEIYVAFIAST